MSTAHFWAVWALTPQEYPSVFLKVLAVAGGAAVGGLLVGFLGKALTRMLTTGAMPPWGVRLLRVGGAVAGGWLVALFVFSGGGSGIGGSGGGKIGDSGSSPSPSPSQPADENKDKKGEPKPSKLVRVEVLGNETLDILKQPTGKGARRYRIEGEARLYDLEGKEGKEGEEGIKDALRKRRKEVPSLKVILVRYNDTPDKEGRIVADLEGWLKKEKMWEKFDPTEQDSPEVKKKKKP